MKQVHSKNLADFTSNNEKCYLQENYKWHYVMEEGETESCIRI